MNRCIQKIAGKESLWLSSMLNYLSLGAFLLLALCATSCKEVRHYPGEYECGEYIGGHNPDDCPDLSKLDPRKPFHQFDDQIAATYVPPDESFEHQDPIHAPNLTALHELEQLSGDFAECYTIGSGDVIELFVWNRPEVSGGNLLVGPDGVVSIPRVGNVKLSGLTREGSEEVLKKRLSELYDNPDLNVSIKTYNNNRVFVLGRVCHPGIIQFPGQGTLLEAITIAGGVAGAEEDLYSTECSILRGKDTIIWIDLMELLQEGNMTLNAKLKPNDVIYVPRAKQYLIYVMGQVAQPRAIPLRVDLSLMDAIMMAGGPTYEANYSDAYLIRSAGPDSVVKRINIKQMIATGDMTQNFKLQPHDIIYVGEKNLSRFNYHLSQIAPSLRFINLTESVIDGFGPNNNNNNNN